MRDRICIIIQNLNQKDQALDCLASLHQIEHKLLTLTVVDHGSTDGSVEAIRSAYPKVPIFEEKKNLGPSEGFNQAIRWALTKPFKWMALFTVDAIVNPNIITEWLKMAEKHPSTKIFGACVYLACEPTQILHLGFKWNPDKAQPEAISCSLPADFISFQAFFVHREVPATIGLFDARLTPIWSEMDYCFRARRKGFGVKAAPLAKVWCSPQTSTSYFWHRSWLLWLERNLVATERKKIPKLRLNCKNFLATIHYYLRQFSILPRP